ncbi:methyltransferase domain-containing protein [Candidatus Woesearchaeota archaeon]|nr:methyltransferase domain-containing protein [Candidatus Woesearchaeota archaeon]
MEKRIIKFLTRESIERLTLDQLNQKLDDNMDEESAQMLRMEREMGNKIDEKPQFYDLYQNLEPFYDLRIGFLTHMEKVFEQMPKNRQLTIVDGGCATGLDTCFLALEHPEHILKGYDNQERSIDLAKERKKRLGLKNVKFYVGDHTSPKPEELDSVDILISKMVSCDNGYSVQSTTKTIVHSSPRLKNPGLYVFAGDMQKYAGHLSENLKKKGLTLEMTQTIYSSPTWGSAYSHIFRYDGGST